MVCRSHAQELFKLIFSSFHRTLLLFLLRGLTSSSEMGAPNILNPGTVAGNARMGNWIKKVKLYCRRFRDLPVHCKAFLERKWLQVGVCVNMATL